MQPSSIGYKRAMFPLKNVNLKNPPTVGLNSLELVLRGTTIFNSKPEGKENQHNMGLELPLSSSVDPAYAS